MDSESMRPRIVFIFSVAFLAGIISSTVHASTFSDPLPEPTEVVIAANAPLPFVSDAEGDDNGRSDGGAAIRDAIRESPESKARPKNAERAAIARKKREEARAPANTKRVPMPGDAPVPGAPPAPTHMR
jgi:hypothetical protein